MCQTKVSTLGNESCVCLHINMCRHDGCQFLLSTDLNPKPSIQTLNPKPSEPYTL